MGVRAIAVRRGRVYAFRCIARFAGVACLSLGCAALTGCVVMAAAGLNLAAGLVLGTAAYVPTQMYASAERERCLALGREGLEVTDSTGPVIPAGEGRMDAFEPTGWRVRFEGDEHTQAREGPMVYSGKLVLTEQSIYFVLPDGSNAVRIPYGAVDDLTVRTIDTVMGTARAAIVRSCFGRSDVFTFGHGQAPYRPDPEAAELATAQLKARLASFRAAATPAGATPRE